MGSFFQYCRNRRGQAMVEMALALPLLVIIMASVLDVGRVIFAQMTVTSAASAGARNYIASLNTTSAMSVAASAASTIGDVALPIVTTTSSAGVTTVTVIVNAKVTILTPVIGTIIQNPFPVSGKATM